MLKLLKCLKFSIVFEQIIFAPSNKINKEWIDYATLHDNSKSTDQKDKFINSFKIFFLVGNMPLNFLTFLKLPLWSSRKKPEHSIILGLIVAAR